MGFRIAEKFRLEVHWAQALYEEDGVAKLVGCCLSGPAVKQVEQMNPNDVISLDFAKQYIVFVKHFYIAMLSWEDVKQTAEKIYLSNVKLTNKYVNSVPKLNHSDYIVIDTQDHENEKHQYNLTYPSYLIRFDGELYKFEG